MTDTYSMNSSTQDESILDAGEETPELGAGEEMPELESGDDLAQKALTEAHQAALPSAGPVVSNSQQLGETLTALQNIIERNANELDRIKDEIKTQREALKNIFENDNELNEAEEQVSVVTQKVKERKSKIQSSPQVTQYKTKISELSEQKKEIEEALNNHLLNLYQVTGSKTFDTSDGEQREFNIRASIKGAKKAQKND